MDGVAFLSNSANRLDVLRALADEPHTRRGLVEATDASRPTVGRILGEFERRNWIERADRNYELTPLGRLVLDAFADVLAVMETERKLRTVVRWLPTDMPGFELEFFADATVEVPEPGRSHRPIRRFVELAEDAESARGFGIATLAPTSARTLFRKAASGMDTRIVYPAAVLEAILESTPGPVRNALDRDCLVTRIHDDLPCGLYVFDDRVVLGGYDRDTGVLRVVVDTDDPDALEWADSVYETYWRDAEPFDPGTLLDPRDGNPDAGPR